MSKNYYEHTPNEIKAAIAGLWEGKLSSQNTYAPVVEAALCQYLAISEKMAWLVEINPIEEMPDGKSCLSFNKEQDSLPVPTIRDEKGLYLFSVKFGIDRLAHVVLETKPTHALTFNGEFELPSMENKNV